MTATPATRWLIAVLTALVIALALVQLGIALESPVRRADDLERDLVGGNLLVLALGAFGIVLGCVLVAILAGLRRWLHAALIVGVTVVGALPLICSR
jgi:hypothetical protein